MEAKAIDNLDVPKHVALREFLIAEITQKSPGSRLDSVKEIMGRYKVSQSTVDRALGFLKQEGYVESYVGRGTFVSEGVQESGDDFMRINAPYLDLILFGPENTLKEHGFHYDLVASLNQKLNEAKKWLRLTVIPPEARLAKYIPELEKMDIKAAIMLHPRNPIFGETLLSRDIPCVHVVPHWPVDLPNSINIDNRGVVNCWLDCLVKHGHRKIAYIHAVQEGIYNRDMNKRLFYYYQEMVKQKMPINPDLLRYAGSDRTEGYRAMKELLRTTRDFTAVIINDHCAPGVYDALTEEGLAVGQDVSVIGTDNLLFTSHMSPPLTTVEISRRLLAEKILFHIDQMQSNGIYFDPEFIPVQLLERQSVAEVAG